jgi:preprotein translocase subunit YajC
MLLALTTLFAADEAAKPAWASLMPLLLLGGGFLLLMMFTSRKQKNQQNQLLANLKRNDKVITASGIIGVVVDVREKRDDDIKEEELVIRVDDSTNTRMRVLKTSIARVFASQPAAVAADKK